MNKDLSLEVELTEQEVGVCLQAAVHPQSWCLWKGLGGIGLASLCGGGVDMRV